MKNQTADHELLRNCTLCIFRLSVFCLTLMFAANASGQKADAQKVEEALKRVQRWHFNERDLQNQDARLLAHAGATQALPSLKQEFAVTRDAWAKLAIASAIVELGDKDPVYWNLLSDEARAAIENDAPSMFLLDAEGKVDRNQRELAPEFIAWARAHELDPAAAAQAQILEVPAKFLALAVTGDPRGREVLRIGLKSRNRIIQSYAALGLAKLQDRDSIPMIIEVGRKMPKDGSTIFVASALLFFDDPEAQSAAEMFISDKKMLQDLRRRIRPGVSDPFLF